MKNPIPNEDLKVGQRLFCCESWRVGSCNPEKLSQVRITKLNRRYVWVDRYPSRPFLREFMVTVKGPKKPGILYFFRTKSNFINWSNDHIMESRDRIRKWIRSNDNSVPIFMLMDFGYWAQESRKILNK